MRVHYMGYAAILVTGLLIPCISQIELLLNFCSWIIFLGFKALHTYHIYLVIDFLQYCAGCRYLIERTDTKDLKQQILIIFYTHTPSGMNKKNDWSPYQHKQLWCNDLPCCAFVFWQRGLPPPEHTDQRSQPLSASTYLCWICKQVELTNELPQRNSFLL